jgi:hypothetical protein
MPVAGSSLVGLLPDEVAMDYLAKHCCYAPGADLAEELAAARAKLGTRTANRCGEPESKPLPASEAAHEAAVRATARFGQFTAACEFRIVEIAPLLACQVHVTLNAHEDSDPLNLCLPITINDPTVGSWSQGGEDFGSLLLTCDDLNFRVLKGGASASTPGEGLVLVGAGLGVGAPFVQVLRWKDRCYLANGFHRAYKLMMGGATEMPCLFRDIDDPDPAKIIQPFGEHLQAADPPATIGDFALGYEVPIRKTRREVSVNWSQLVVPVE